MKDTAMYVDVSVLKYDIKAGISWNANEKNKSSMKFAILQEAKYKITLETIFVATWLFSKILKLFPNLFFFEKYFCV